MALFENKASSLDSASGSVVSSEATRTKPRVIVQTTEGPEPNPKPRFQKGS